MDIIYNRTRVCFNIQRCYHDMIPYSDRVDIAKEKQVKDNHHLILLKVNHTLLLITVCYY